MEKMRKIYGELKKNDINNNLESKNNQIISNESNIIIRKSHLKKMNQIILNQL